MNLNLAQNPSLATLNKEWESLSMRMAYSHRGGFYADASPEELQGSFLIEQALKQVEQALPRISSENVYEQSKAIDEVLRIYKSEENGLRHDISYQAGCLAARRDGGSEPFAFAARLMVAAATTIAVAAQQANDATTLNELKASLEAAVSGLSRIRRGDAEVLSLVLSRQLARLSD